MNTLYTLSECTLTDPIASPETLHLTLCLYMVNFHQSTPCALLRDMQKIRQQQQQQQYGAERDSIDFAEVDHDDITHHDITQSTDIAPAYDIETNTGSTHCTHINSGTTTSSVVTNLTISISPMDQMPAPHHKHPPYATHHGGVHKKVSSRNNQYEMAMTPMSPSALSMSGVSLNSLNSLSKASHRSSVIDMLTSSAAASPHTASSQSTATTTMPSPCSPLDRYNHMVANGQMDLEEDLPDDEKESEQAMANLARTAENQLLYKHGFVKVAKICDTLQGVVYKAERINSASSPRSKRGSRRSALEQYGQRRKTGDKAVRFVSIKKTSRNLYDRKISYVDESTDMTYCIEEDVVEEGKILKHLTVDHKLNDGHIVKYIDFFQSKTDYYLVTEYGMERGCTLRDFIEDAQQHIDDGRLEINDYIKVIRYLFWQLFATIHWLHQDIKCM